MNTMNALMDWLVAHLVPFRLPSPSVPVLVGAYSVHVRCLVKRGLVSRPPSRGYLLCWLTFEMRIVLHASTNKLRVASGPHHYRISPPILCSCPSSSPHCRCHTIAVGHWHAAPRTPAQLVLRPLDPEPIAVTGRVVLCRQSTRRIRVHLRLYVVLRCPADRQVQKTVQTADRWKQ